MLLGYRPIIWNNHVRNNHLTLMSLENENLSVSRVKTDDIFFCSLDDFSVPPHSRMTAFSFKQWHLTAAPLSRRGVKKSSAFLGFRGGFP